MPSLGRTLIIANPAAHSGRGAQHAAFVERFFESYRTASDGFELRLTSHAGQAQEMALDASGLDTVIALGGDGLIHEIVNGLMALPNPKRPRLGIIPVGTGNDYARTLGVARNDPERSLRQLLQADERLVEVGRVNDVYFMQTLSFGLDAAIAIETNSKKADAGRQGARLFAEAGIRTFSHASQGWPCRVTLDGRSFDLTEIILAFQVGPTYGGGFAVCPDASPVDGLLSVCHNTMIPSVPHALALFGLARFGRHTFSRVLAFDEVRTAVVDFDEAPPCQADGEELQGRHFEIEVVPYALRVLMPR